MPRTVSAKAAVKAAQVAERRLSRGATLPDGSQTKVASFDSFVNFAHKLGIGADNPLSTGSYGFNPITRQRVLLEWIHRGSWIGGVAVDVVADDMTRQGIEYVSEMHPDDSEAIDQLIDRHGVWQEINDTIKWGRLYGGSLGVILIDGQDTQTPLRLNTLAVGSFKGLLPLDRWMVEPVLEDLVTEYGSHLGLPRYYRIQSNAPALRGQTVHYSRCVFRLDGIRLPYQQRLTENLWGISVLERLYDRMIAYDSASTGAAQLVYKAYLRTLSVDGMREIVSAGGPAMDGLIRYTEMMRRFQGIEGITLIDAKDKYEQQTHGGFSGLSDALMHFAEQLSGALQIPLTRLFGQSPAGLNATGDNDIRNYYDHIKQRQERDLRMGVMTTYRCAALSLGIELPKNFAVNFRSLWQLTESDKSNIAKTTSDSILAVREAALISDQIALRELRQASRTSGIFTNITADLIESADAEVEPPAGEGAIDPETGQPIGEPPMPKIPGVENFTPSARKEATANANSSERPPAAPGEVGTSAPGGKVIRAPTLGRRPADQSALRRVRTGGQS